LKFLEIRKCSRTNWTDGRIHYENAG